MKTQKINLFDKLNVLKFRILLLILLITSSTNYIYSQYFSNGFIGYLHHGTILKNPVNINQPEYAFFDLSNGNYNGMYHFYFDGSNPITINNISNFKNCHLCDTPNMRPVNTVFRVFTQNPGYYIHSLNLKTKIEIDNIYLNNTNIVNLTEQTNKILYDYDLSSVSFYLTENDALNMTNPLSNNFTLSSNSQTIYVRTNLSNYGLNSDNLISNFQIKVNSNDVINIPDIALKQKLVSSSTSNGIARDNLGSSIKIDSNDDGEISINEIENVYELQLNNSWPNQILNLKGINYFKNLKKLNLLGNSLRTLDAIQHLKINYLDISNNDILNVNDYRYLSKINTLNTLILNNMGSVDVFGTKLGYLDFLQPSSSIKNLSINDNEFINLNKFQNFLSLNELSVVGCGLTNYELTGLGSTNSLQVLNISTNPITNLNFISNYTILRELNFSNSQVTTIPIFSNNLLLKNINCSNNQLNSSISNLENLTQLNQLNISNVGLNQFNFNNLSNLITLQCGNNQLQSLDLSNHNNIFLLYCNNNQLTQLKIKNGKNETLNFSNNPNLQYICCDDSQLTSVQQIVNQYGYSSTCNVNSYCSFEPGGNHNTITGVTQNDSNTNGCDASDPVFQHLKLNINDGINQGATFSNNAGIYNFFTLTGTFTVTPQFENPNYFNATPTNAVQTFTNNNNNVATHNFCITPNGVKNDVEVVLSPTVPARPGFDAHYRLVFKNKGNQTLSGTIVLNFDDTRLDFVSSNPATTNQQPSTLTWNYANLLPFENRAIDIILNVNSPQETPAVNIGDVLPFTTIINPVTGDEIPADNTFALNQIVVGAYDPNDITCLQGETVDPTYIGQFLHYQIRFENTGNFPAENVVVAYFVNTNDYDLNTLQILNTSHNQLYTRITGNKVEFIFENIQLAPSSGGGGHGTIIIKMKTKNNLVVGDAVAKQANIYFDYNFPIETNEAETTFATLSIGDTLQINDFSIYPNPAQDILNIKTKTLIKKVELFDMQGRLLQTHFNNANETTLDIQKYNSCTYFVKVYTENGVGTQKLVKE